MAKISGPLFSVAASGSVGALTFSRQIQPVKSDSTQQPKTHIARAKPKKSSIPPTPDQLACRAKCRAAAAAWAALTMPQRADWKNLGITTHRAGQGNTALNCKNGWPVFLQEWIIQHITTPSTPMLPARYE